MSTRIISQSTTLALISFTIQARVLLFVKEINILLISKYFRLKLCKAEFELKKSILHKCLHVSNDVNNE